MDCQDDVRLNSSKISFAHAAPPFGGGPTSGTKAPHTPMGAALLDGAEAYLDGVIETNLSPTLLGRLRELECREHISLPLALLGGWAILVSRWWGYERLVIGLSINAGRMQCYRSSEVKDAIRLDLDLHPSKTTKYILE